MASNLSRRASALAMAASASAGGNPAQQAAAANAAADAAVIVAGNTGLDPATAAAQLGQIASKHPVAFAVAMMLAPTGQWAKWEKDSSMNPIGGPDRRKPFPVKFLPANTNLLNGIGTFTFAPQEEFEAFRLCVPSGQAPGPMTFTQLQAGDRLMQAQSGRVPSSCWSEKSDLGRIDFPIVRLGETITMQVQQVTPSGTPEASAVLFGYARGKGRKLPDGAQLLYERVEPFDVTVIAPLGTATVSLQPQRNIIMRRIGVDDTALNAANLFITSINVQDDPQYVGNAEIPASLFSELAQDDWLDFDMCQLGGLITIGVRNTNTSQSAVFQGMALCDLVRLPGDAR